MKGLTGNILRTFSTQIPAIIIGVFSGIFLTRLLGAEGKGVYALFLANIEIMVMIFVLGCDMGIVYYGSNKQISEQKLQAIALYVVLLFFPLLSILIFSFDFSFLFPKGYSTVFFKFFLLGMFGLTVINTLLKAFLKTSKSFRYINRINLFNNIFNLVVFSTLYFLHQQELIVVSLQFIFTLSLSILFLNTLLWVFSFTKKHQFIPDFSVSVKTDLLPFFAYIFPVFISIVINFLNYRFDIWLVKYFDGFVQLGLYALAVNFAQFILLYSKIIGGVMMPYLSENDDVQRKKYFVTYSRINFTSVAIMIGVLVLFGDKLLVFLYGEEFADSAAPFNYLLIGMLFTAMSQLFSIMLFSKGKANIALIANSIGLIATLVGDLLLIPKYGIVGAAIATSISYFVLFLFLLINLLAKEKIRFSELFIIKRSDFKTIFSDS